MVDINESCSLEAVVSIDERGQMVLPKELREKMGIKAGDKLALTLWKKNSKPCCITMTKVAELAEKVKDTLGELFSK